MKDNKLEVGDKIVSNLMGKWCGCTTVIQVDDKSAICESGLIVSNFVELNKSLKPIKEVGINRYNDCQNYYFVSPEIDRKIKTIDKIDEIRSYLYKISEIFVTLNVSAVNYDKIEKHLADIKELYKTIKG